jgi:hypothetical protein
MKTKLMQLADAYEGMSRLLPEDVAKARAALEAEIDRVCKDAERYQWLRERDLPWSHKSYPQSMVVTRWSSGHSPDEIDAAIDAAMQGEAT